MIRPFTPEEDKILIEGISCLVKSSSYREWDTVTKICNALRQERGISDIPRPEFDYFHRYMDNLIFKINEPGFKEKNIAIKDIPWRPSEFQALRKCIPADMPGGLTINDYFATVGQNRPAANWRHISSSLNQSRRSSARIYDPQSVKRAYIVRILPEYNQALAQITRPTMAPAVIHPLFMGTPEVLKNALGAECSFHFAFQWGVGWIPYGVAGPGNDYRSLDEEDYDFSLAEFEDDESFWQDEMFAGPKGFFADEKNFFADDESSVDDSSSEDDESLDRYWEPEDQFERDEMDEDGWMSQDEDGSDDEGEQVSLPEAGSIKREDGPQKKKKGRR